MLINGISSNILFFPSIRIKNIYIPKISAFNLELVSADPALRVRYCSNKYSWNQIHTKSMRYIYALTQLT
jgi:hypothetical protein